MNREFFENLNPVCNHSWVYKILSDHTAADCCEKCGLIRPQYCWAKDADYNNDICLKQCAECEEFEEDSRGTAMDNASRE